MSRNLKKSQIVMLSLHGLGDTLMFLPTIKSVCSAFPNADIRVLTRNKSTKEMLDFAHLGGNVSVDYIGAFDSWRFRLGPFNLLVLLKVIRLNPDIIVSMTRLNNYLMPVLMKLTRSRVTVGESHGWGKHLLTHPVETDLKAHRALRNLSLLSSLEIPLPSKPDLRLFPGKESLHDTVVLMKKLMPKPPKICFAVAPCVTLGQRWRFWPCEYWAKLMEMLTEEFDAACFLLGGPSKEESQIADKIMQNLADGVRVYNLVGQLPIKDTIALISLMDYICGIDCGLLHIAASVDTFIHAIWSITQVEHYPFTEKKQILTVNCPCRKDYPKNISPECLKKPQCLERFLPEAAFESIQSVWASRNSMSKIEQYW